LPLRFVVGEFDNKRTIGSVHDNVLVQYLDRLECCFTFDISQERSAFASAVGVSDHVNFSDLAERGKNFSHLDLRGFSGQHTNEEFVFWY